MKYKNIYFVGIGGIGMSALARYFKHFGLNVSGYDKTETKLTNELKKEGVDICFIDNADFVREFDIDTTLVVYTPAIPKDSEQLNYFISNGFEVKKRSQVLGLITKQKKALCVAGTHGKTTTSTMLAHLLKQSDVDCNAFLGGISQNYGSNLLLSDNSDYVVVEADEFDRSFLNLQPYASIISSIDADHLDIYSTGDAIEEAFQDFANLTSHNGFVLLNHKIASKVKCRSTKYTYSLDDTSSDFFASNIQLNDNGFYTFDLNTPSKKYSNFTMGIHALVNVENAVAALAMAYLVGAKVECLKKALSSFVGIKRRFQYRIKESDFVLIDDYAHHPEEINATIKSLKALYPKKSITAVFQPHLFTRTRDFLNQFAESLSKVDKLILLDIYPARELPIEGISSQCLLDMVDVEDKHLTSKEGLTAMIEQLQPQVLITMGAGDIDKEVDKIVDFYNIKNNKY